MSTVLKVAYEEDDIKKVLRLGKKGMIREQDHCWLSSVTNT
jgi:hypothetical protein